GMTVSRSRLEDKYLAMSRYENAEIGKGRSFIAGIDEAGRGPLAGPVVAAACILRPGQPILGLDDSKKLSPGRRDELYQEIVSHALAFAVVRVEHEVIDAINILNATKEAMRRCVAELAVMPDVLLIDAVDLKGTGIDVVPIIKGDSLSVSIAAASILAKVTRDRIMEDYDRIYPGYGFAAHKGYGTSAHYEAIGRLGITPIHRKTFLKGRI
ncbi:MAG: ribonuclease HII, partial [Saccharofermentanales bacterium]